MNFTWASFKKNPYFLTRYLGTHFLSLILLNVLLFKINKDVFYFDVKWLSLIPLAMITGIVVPVFMHNCMHANFRTKFLDEFLGEIASFFALMGLEILRVNHTLHHAHADTEADPHSPSDKSFLTFLFTGQFTGAAIIQQRYLSIHGDTPKKRLLFKLNCFFHYASQPLRLLLWYSILGQNLFFYFYLPAFVTYSLAFAHINYVTHRELPNGDVQILNMDSNLYYKFINFIGSGVYYHKNHHLRPRLINPKKVAL